MKSAQLLATARRIADNFVRLVVENELEILSAIAATQEEAELQEADKIVFSMAHGIKINLTNKHLNETLTWAVKSKLEVCEPLPDPDQPELPFAKNLAPGESVEIQIDGKNVAKFTKK